MENISYIFNFYFIFMVGWFRIDRVGSLKGGGWRRGEEEAAAILVILLWKMVKIPFLFSLKFESIISYFLMDYSVSNGKYFFCLQNTVKPLNKPAARTYRK